MKRNHPVIITLALCFLALALATPLLAASMGASGGHDLDRLWTQAQQHYNLDDFDAIVLLESRQVSLPADGIIRTTVHRVVWIGTARGIRDYADLRIPWNSATSTMTVTALRTWRDDRWWPDATEVSPTAVVETLPYAVALADDYNAMRETMLLHDGVGLPCIMETAYTIEEHAVNRGGFGGVFVFAQEDPAVVSMLALTLPASSALANKAAHGAPDAAITKGSDGTITYTWAMEYVEPLGVPNIASPLCYAPHLAWSTWSDWQAMGSAFVNAFDQAAVVQGAVADSLIARLKHEPSPAAQARKVVALVNEWTRAVHYDAIFWMFAPRPAMRTFETAYGHDLDRAVLAAGLFRSWGFEAKPFLYSNGSSIPLLTIPVLAFFENIGVTITDGDFNAFYDARTGELIEGVSPLIAHFIWRPLRHKQPFQLEDTVAKSGSRYELSLTIEPGAENSWDGHGFCSADNALCPYNEMVGLGNEMKSHVKAIAGSILPDPSVNSCNPEIFNDHKVAVGFDLGIKQIEPDKLGRTVFTIGDPAGGIHSRLPHDIHLYQEQRTSPVVLSQTFSQKVTLRLKTGASKVVSLPAANEIVNDIGSFSVKVSEDDGWITVERNLTLNGGVWAPDRWTELRNLLLGDKDSAGRTIVLE